MSNLFGANKYGRSRVSIVASFSSNSHIYVDLAQNILYIVLMSELCSNNSLLPQKEIIL